LGQLHGERKLVSVDMGGTSFDIGLVEGGIPKVTTEGNFQRLPVKIPIIDLHIIGAGGGSIAWIDRGGALNVGPMSAGADPGPVCYNLGGDEPTVTDANLVLGRLNPDYFNGGEMPLFPDLAKESIEKSIGKALDMSVEEAAMGIIKVINANMVKGISSVTIQRGIDTREWSLASFGGSGGVHALDIARDLNMSRVVVPPFAGTFSAIGLLVSDTRHDYVQTITMREDDLDLVEMTRIFGDLEEKGRLQLEEERIRGDRMEFMWSADIKLVGQTYEINTPVERVAEITPAAFQKALGDFKTIYREKYSYIHEGEKVEVVSLRVSAFGKSPPVELKGRGDGETDPTGAVKEKRPIYFDRIGFEESAIYERDRLGPGCELTGPCMIEEATASTLILPGYRGRVEEDGSIAIAL
jgi:N-methylhydantoinase A